MKQVFEARYSVFCVETNMITRTYKGLFAEKRAEKFKKELNDYGKRINALVTFAVKDQS